MRHKSVLFFYFIIIPFLFSPIYMYAGITGKLTGFIIDANTNEPLIGAYVIIDETRLGAVTNQSGSYAAFFHRDAETVFFPEYHVSADVVHAE